LTGGESRLTSDDETLLSRAEVFAAALGSPLFVAVLRPDEAGSTPPEVRLPLLSIVYLIEHGALCGGDGEAYGRAALCIFEKVEPVLVLFSHTPLGRVAASWLAVHLRAPVVPGCSELRVEGDSLAITRRIHGRAVTETECVNAKIAVLTVETDRDSADQVAIHAEVAPVIVSDGNLNGVETRIRVTASEPATGQSLRTAKVIVSAGAGVRSDERYRELQELSAYLGAGLGGSKPAVERGWVTAAQKVGLTGETVAPDVYLAVGISGASQHMAGCARSKVIVAINSDRRAPIFRYARFGVVGDVDEIVPALLEAVRAASS
jgi:electron transfer flavoprotein alpha subunit